MAFFDRYANFVPDPQANLVEEFARLAVATGMNPCGATYRRRRREFFIEEFNLHWGTDGTKLKIWQRLCREVRIDPVPVSITQCKKALKSVYVNLIDLVDCRRKRTPVHRFQSLGELRQYTIPNMIFPRSAAKKDGFLHALLQNIF